FRSESDPSAFRHLEGAVPPDQQLHIEAGNRERAARLCGGRAGEVCEGDERGGQRPRTCRVAHQNRTCGTARSAPSISKNSRGRMRNQVATRLEGNCATFVLRSRTTAL